MVLQNRLLDTRTKKLQASQPIRRPELDLHSEVAWQVFRGGNDIEPPPAFRMHLLRSDRIQSDAIREPVGGQLSERSGDDSGH